MAFVAVRKGDACIARPSTPDAEKCLLQPSGTHSVRHANTTVQLCVTDSAFHFSNSVAKNRKACPNTGGHSPVVTTPPTAST